MSVTIDTPTIHKSFATVLSAITPNAVIYDNPNQQGTKLPAWFIVHREPVKIEREIGRAWLIYSINLCYLLEYNTTRLFDDYAEIADSLNTSLVYLPIFGTDFITQVYEREWSVQLDALVYSTTLRFRVRPDTVLAEYMEVIESLETFIKNGKLQTVTFTNTEHPDFEVEYPESIMVKNAHTVTLPDVTGSFVDSSGIYTPLKWTIGEFGEKYRVYENVSTDLEWNKSSFPEVVLGENWLYASGKAIRILEQPPEGAMLYYDGTQPAMKQPTETWSVIEWQSEEGVSSGHTEVKYLDYGMMPIPINMVVQNNTDEPLQFYRLRAAICNSNAVTTVIVLNESDVSFYAFKYSAGATNYYFVIDGINDGWVSDLSSIGYRIEGE